MSAKEVGKKMKHKKSAASKGRPSTPSHQMPEGLAEHGNAFMRMFDDHDETTVKRKGKQVSNAKPAVSKAAAEEKKRKRITAAQEASEGAAHANAPTSTDAEMDEIFASAGSKARRGKSGAVQGRPSSAAGGGAAEVVTFVDPSRGRDGAALREQEARERRRFMSCKVSKVHQEAEQGAVLASGAGDELNTDRLVSQSAFKEMQREAEELGATALDKKSRKAYEEQKLRAIGAKAEKGPRIGALIGKGMAKKQEERGARALEEAINAGLVQRKGLGKKKRRMEQAAGKPKSGTNDGLGGRFKDGILHVKPMGAPRGINRKKSFLKGIKL